MSSAPLKLKFKLGNATTAAQDPSAGTVPTATTAQSAVASDSNAFGGAVDAVPAMPPHPQPSSITGSPAPNMTLGHMVLPKLEALPSSSAPDSDAGTSDTKPKRKRAPRRAAGEPGPGKAWRKGLKGTIVAGQVDTTQLPTLQPASGVGSPSMSRTGSNTVAAGPSSTLQAQSTVNAGRVSTGWPSSMIPDYRTPKPRKWHQGQQDITTVSGNTIKLRSWIGAPVSLYAEMRKTRPANTASSTTARTAVPIRHVPAPSARGATPTSISTKNSPVPA
ncbi:hypothetical protein OIV83_001697 [Microbotryomycetes sp. JL201]|nr:hypothetical protein OIV83_001697 [Microbotryomycetes sp. JL201]